MVRKLISAVGVGAVFASGAFAAGFDINDGKASELGTISSGSIASEDCTAGLKLDVQHGGTSSYDATLNDFSVTGVRVAAADAAGQAVALGDVCEGFAVTAVLKHAPGGQATVSTSVEHLIGAGDDLVVLALAAGAPAVWVDDLTEVSVLVDQPDLAVPTTLDALNAAASLGSPPAAWTHNPGDHNGPNDWPKSYLYQNQRSDVVAHPVALVPIGRDGLDHFQSECASTEVTATRWVTITSPYTFYRASVFASLLHPTVHSYGHAYTREAVLVDAQTGATVNRSAQWPGSITFYRDQHRVNEEGYLPAPEGIELLAGVLYCAPAGFSFDETGLIAQPGYGQIGVSFHKLPPP